MDNTGISAGKDPGPSSAAHQPCAFPTKWAGPELALEGAGGSQGEFLEVIHASLASRLLRGIIYACPGLTICLGHLLLVTMKEETPG